MMYNELAQTAKEVFLAYFRYYSAMWLKWMWESTKKHQPV